MDKNESMALKAFAVGFMFWHHLFGCGTFLTNGVSYPFFSFGSKFESAIGVGCKLCISLFAFASGYGLYKSYIEKAKYSKILSSIFKFLIQYWIIVFIVAVPYLIIYDKFNLDYLLVNLFALLHNDEMLYVSLSWYVKVHLEFLIICPLIKYISPKLKSFQEEIFIFIVLPKMLSLVLPSSESEFVNLGINLISSINLLFCWLPVFYVGVLFAKYNIIEKIRTKALIKKNCKGMSELAVNIVNVVISVALITAAPLLRARWGEDSLTNSLCVVVFLIGFDELYYRVIKNKKMIEKVVAFVGEHSFQFWLLSGMFFLNTTEFAWLLFIPKIRILICIWNFVILIPLAIMTKKIADFLTQIVLKRKKVYN